MLVEKCCQKLEIPKKIYKKLLTNYHNILYNIVVILCEYLVRGIE